MQAELAREMIEAAGNRQGGRGEDPRRMTLLAQFTQWLREIEWCRMQGESVRAQFIPMHGIVRTAVAQVGEPRTHGHGALVHGGKAATAFGMHIECAGQFVEGDTHLLQPTLDLGIALDDDKGSLGRKTIQRQAQAAHGRRDGHDQGLQGGQRTACRGTFSEGVGGQLGQLARSQGDREELPGQLGNLMRLIEDEGMRAGQDFAETFLADGEVGKQQVVIDDDDVGFLRGAARLDHEAVVEERAIAAEAVFRGRSHPRPQRRILGQLGKFGAIATLRRLRPGMDRLQLADLLTVAEMAFAARLFEAMQAKVIGAALEQGRGQGRAEHAAHTRQIAMEQLVLQRLGAGGDDHALARDHCRHQVGKGLAGAGAGLGNQGMAIIDRLGHGAGHDLLHLARHEPRHFTREWAFGPQQFLDRLVHAANHRSAGLRDAGSAVAQSRTGRLTLHCSRRVCACAR